MANAVHMIRRPPYNVYDGRRTFSKKNRNVQAKALLDIKRKAHFGKQIALTTAANAHTLEPKIKIFFHSEKPP